jgi:peptidyl-prolyl cis-trans isomerase D
MLGSFRKGRANVLIWALMGALVVGLGGFGIVRSGGIAPQDIARVGDRDVTTDDFVRALQQELRAYSQQIGRDMPMSEARQFGVDRQVLARLVNDAALDEEAARLDLSTGDDRVRQQVMATQAFQGADGKFSRDAYAFALERIGLRPAEFEELLRREATRELVASGVRSAVRMPDTAARTVLDFLGEKRGFRWIRLDAGLLPAPVAAPSEADLEAEYQAHPDRYTRPETRRITYAGTTPEALAATIEIPEDKLRAAYDAAIADYQTPERRVGDRIGFASMDEATAARARLDSGAVDFDALAAERGLQPADLDQGFLTADRLSGPARDAVMGAATPGLVGPVDTPLGPSIYRINAILAASTKPFESVQADLAHTQALAEAQRRIHEDIAAIEDLLAGGATIEEVAADTVLEPGTLSLAVDTKGGIVDDPAFREAAMAADTGVESDLIELADGGLATLRIDTIDPPALIPLAEVRDRVIADWTAEQSVQALTTLADGYAKELHDGLAFAALAERLPRPMQVAGPLTRGETAPGAPAELVADVFAAEDGGTVVRRDRDGVVLAQLKAIAPFDPDAPDTAPVAAQLQGQYDGQVADDVLALYTAALREQVGVTVNQALIDSTLSRFQ